MRNIVGLICLCLAALIPCECEAVDVPSSPSEAIRRLDAAVARHDVYIQRRKSMIDSLTHASDSSAASMLAIGDTYRKFCVDSALQYYYQVIPSADPVASARATLRLSSLLPVSGNLGEAIRLFDSVDKSALPDTLRREYHIAGNQLYFYASSLTRVPKNKNDYAALALQHTDSLLAYLPPNSAAYLLFNAERSLMRGDHAQAVADLMELIGKARMGDPQLALAATMMAYHWEGTQRPDRQKIFLALAAESDLTSGTREMTALQELGRMLQQEGDEERAFSYLNLALDVTLESGSRLRIMDAASAMPIMAAAMHQKSRDMLSVIITLSCFVLLLMAAVGVLLWKMRDSRRQLDENAAYLQESLADRELHIRHVLALCSECIDRLEEYNLIAARKIKAKQVTELYDLVQSRKLLHEQHQKFLCTFDDTFLSIYPDFIAEVNALLLPDKQVALPKPRTLSPELRIMAMLRLGIDDAQTIAKLLDLSVNTVYTYRNKMKSRASDRDNFEESVKARP